MARRCAFEGGAFQRGERVAGVHVHAAHDDPVPPRVVDQAVRSVEPHRLVAQQRGGERGRVVPLQPRARVDQVGEADRVRLGEPVVGEGQDLDVDVLGDGRTDAAFSHPVEQPVAQFLDSLGGPLGAHGLAQPVGLVGGEARAVDGQLHHLLLEQRHAERLAERRAHRLVRHLRVLQAVAAAQVGVDRAALDRARPDQRDLDDQVVELPRPQPGQAWPSGPATRPGTRPPCRPRYSIW